MPVSHPCFRAPPRRPGGPGATTAGPEGAAAIERVTPWRKPNSDRGRTASLSRPRPQVPARDLRRPDRPGGHGPHAEQRLRHRPHRPRLHAHRRARRRQDHHRPPAGPRAQLRERDRPRARRPDARAVRGPPLPRRSSRAGTWTCWSWTPPRAPTSTRCASCWTGVRYAPVEARYKVYIIDEVHMLSTAAFNALLKTLEEPPPHAKFIFATTEIRKVPVTILSRCQRFDLRRVEPEVIVEQPRADRRGRGRADRGRGAGADRPRRRGLGARRPVAARPGDGAGRGRRRGRRRRRCATCWAWPTAAQTIELFEKAVRGDAPARRSRPSAPSTASAPTRRWCCRPAGALPLGAASPRRIGPRRAGAAEGPGAAAGGDGRGSSRRPACSRLWQMLLKGLRRGAPRARSRRAAVEMALIRLAYAADLPGPEEALKALQNGGDCRRRSGAAGVPPRRRGGGGGGGASAWRRSRRRPPQPQPAVAPIASAAAASRTWWR